MQMPMLLSFKEIFRDIESFHIWGICVVNQALNSKKNDNSQMNKDDYMKKYLFNSDHKNRVGINAMSISEITGIPRATVIRKLNKLIDENFLLIDEKKQYLTTGVHKEKLIEVQKNNYINLSKFSVRIYNLTIS